ncbi:thiaminase II [Paracoccus sp. TK19116]|uniref:Aminopyrimidine aminohydrolase n=1 Tax=Paracoccus albicereus TaxID=2922394 RepID=A0ABT1MQ63_9RHOB|nr:thiaminase II [Paracoccus albicereus]MCQ0969651.1 thiaminase II [Paracoccus albicereus]
MNTNGIAATAERKDLLSNAQAENEAARTLSKGGPDYGVTFPLWRAAAGASWHDYTRHPFVEGLGDGTLPRKAFMRYLVQDYLFLVQFSRAWALAVTKAETLDEMRACAKTVHALLDKELHLHVAICAAEGIPEAELFSTREAPQNIAYTRYVLDAGHSGDFLDLIAALTPCVLGYGEIGARLASRGNETGYADWIATYAASGYQDTCRAVGSLIDSAVAYRLGSEPQESPRWRRLCNRFETATRLEVDFWEMGLSG